MLQLLEYICSFICLLGWMAICYVEVAIIPFAIALFLRSLRSNEWEDTSIIVMDIVILIIFPPMAVLEYGLDKALITSSLQIVGCTTVFAIMLLMHKSFGIDFGEHWDIAIIVIITWAVGILYATIQRHKYKICDNNEDLTQTS